MWPLRRPSRWTLDARSVSGVASSQALLRALMLTSTTYRTFVSTWKHRPGMRDWRKRPHSLALGIGPVLLRTAYQAVHRVACPHKTSITCGPYHQSNSQHAPKTGLQPMGLAMCIHLFRYLVELESQPLPQIHDRRWNLLHVLLHVLNTKLN